MKKLKLSVIIPALNEEKNIGEAIRSTLSAFRKYRITGNIIVINDGSTDNTESIVRNIMKRDKRVKFISHSKPMGIGYSFFEGARRSKNDIVVMFPGDNENDPNEALIFFGLLEYVDIVVPFIHNLDVRNRIRRIISSIYRYIINMSFGINLNYTNGTVFYRRCILDDVRLNSYGFFYQAELLVKLIRKGYLYAEVPNFLLTRANGKSKATSLKSLARVIKSYLTLLFEIHIKRVESRKGYKKVNPKSVTYKKHLDYK